ncbi:hypothetical protein GOP47_0017105 [Adiantum capillus-veneris]|uniref:Uncharacterized protein n=1 Tax=Adiantum capillus-veneris TaxID=13818 RepID=A0A9D4UJ21_ADICA|nr:hypothetical protein GOP47_0017105 [Adiantum capillus-veneris]
MASSSGITFTVSPHPARLLTPPSSQDAGHLHMLSYLKEYQQEACHRILHASPVSPLSFEPSNSGFVRAVVEAYICHRNLVIRPDDVWLAILIQFGFYVNANAEAFRSLFVAHQGKKELTVHQVGSLESVDYVRFVHDMVSQLRANITDLSFCDWVLPRFSTTTHDDTIVASVALMASMKKYFEHRFCILCGIPQVTLAGTVQDWEEIDARINRLETGGYGKVCSEWASMLKKISSQFIQTSRNVVDTEFWGKICDYTVGGSGPSFLSGWITAFCVFDGQGNWQATDFTAPISGRRASQQSEPHTLEFPVIDTSDIPPGYITVDVTVDDNGEEHETLMFAGHMGYDIVQEGYGIAPKLAWAIALKGEKH